MAAFPLGDSVGLFGFAGGRLSWRIGCISIDEGVAAFTTKFAFGWVGCSAGRTVDYYTPAALMAKFGVRKGSRLAMRTTHIWTSLIGVRSLKTYIYLGI
jgi:hypothetical protein